MPRMHRAAICFAALVLAATTLPVLGQGPPAKTQPLSASPADALATYVRKPDDTFSWRLQRRHNQTRAEIIELVLEWQTWRETLWKHQLFVIKPRHVSDPQRAVFIIGGGRWRDEYESSGSEARLPEGAELFVRIAQVLDATVVVLGQVPYQPLFDLTEDRLIAHTFDRFLATGDVEWPLLLPMVKSVVRAFDAVGEVSKREWGTELAHFTLLGGSKRGWTTWLTAAVDARVSALAPIVIDALNMERHFPHQTEVWGAPSEEIRPYTELGLDIVLGSTAGAALRQIVDPFAYRARILQPKLVILATNDAYFPLDSANLYWDELAPPKSLLYLPNEPHSIRGYGPVIRGLRALHDAAGGGPPLPQLEWEYRFSPTDTTLCMRADPAPRTWRLWLAESVDRDFRDATWQPMASSHRGGVRLELERPLTGYRAVFGEASFGRGRRAFALSTNLAVSAGVDEPAYGTEPRGLAGVCDRLPVRTARLRD